MWRELCFHNKVLKQGVRQMVASGMIRLNPDTGLIELLERAKSMDFESNWLFFGHNIASRDCYLWHQVMFTYFDNFVPEFCKLRCYKVVVKTRNFLDAIKLYNAILAGPIVRGDLMPLQGKVGIDQRNYTEGYFNGFIYADGLEDALAKYIVVRELVDTQIQDGKNINIIIKRSCTEFEQEHGPTDGEFWKCMTKDELNLQNHLEDMIAGAWGSVVQPDWIKNNVIDNMIKWANTVGDKSWVEYFGGKDFLTMKAVTYHNIPKTKEKKSGDKKPARKKAKVQKCK